MALRRIFLFQIERFNPHSKQYEGIVIIGVAIPSGERAVNIAKELGLCGVNSTFTELGCETDVNAINEYLIAQKELF